MTEKQGTQRANRPKRVPLGMRNVLAAEKRQGFVRRWFNDTDDRLERAKAAGWTAVQKPADASDPRAGADSQMGAIVSKSVGGGVRGVLMEIPEGFYNEDKAAKEANIARTEQGLSRQPGIKGQQYGGVYGKMRIDRRGESLNMDAAVGEPNE